MLMFVREAGWGIYPVFFFGSITLAAAVVYVLRRETRHFQALCALSLLTWLSGVLGTVTGLQAAAHYIEGAPEKWLFIVGVREALNNLVAAILFVALAALVLAVSFLWPGAARTARTSPQGA